LGGGKNRAGDSTKHSKNHLQLNVKEMSLEKLNNHYPIPN